MPQLDLTATELFLISRLTAREITRVRNDKRLNWQASVKAVTIAECQALQNKVEDLLQGKEEKTDGTDSGS